MACTYVVKNSAGEEISFNTQAEALKYARENNLADSPKIGEPLKTTKTLANVLRQMAFGENNYNPLQLRVFQEELLDEFIRMEEQSQYFYRMGSAIALTKGLGKSFDQMNNVRTNLEELGVGLPADEELKAPFDVRYLLTGDSRYKPENSNPYYHKITAGNIKKMNEINSLSRTIFMEQTPSFSNVADKTVANLKDSIAISPDKVREIKDELTAFFQLAAYKQWVQMNDKQTSTLRNSLIYDTNTNTPTIIDIVKEAAKIAPDNTFLKFILPVTTTVKIGKKKVRNINNKDLINTIEGKTRGKIEPDLIANMMDSFAELYQDPRTQYHAKALFDYLIVKDGLMFKNKSFIKMIPTMMFTEVSKAADLSTELLNLSTRQEYGRFIKKLDSQDIVDKEGNYKPYFTQKEKDDFNQLFRDSNMTGVRNKLYQKVFGLTYSNAYTRFEEIYATDTKFQFNLDLIKSRIQQPSGAKKVDGITFAEENGKKYMHVAMFTEKFKATEKESEERSKAFRENMEQLGEAGFLSVDVDEGKSELQFKKFIRTRSPQTQTQQAALSPFGESKKSGAGDYVTYQLVMVERQDSKGKTQRYSGDSMTVEGEKVPRGIYAVYAPVSTVGTSNSSGAADLGVRPTKEQTLETIGDKLKKDDEQTPPPAAPTAPVTPTPTAPVAPTSGETIEGGIFGGMNQLPFDPNSFIEGGDFFTGDSDINEALDNLDNC